MCVCVLDITFHDLSISCLCPALSTLSKGVCLSVCSSTSCLPPTSLPPSSSLSLCPPPSSSLPSTEDLLGERDEEEDAELHPELDLGLGEDDVTQFEVLETVGEGEGDADLGTCQMEGDGSLPEGEGEPHTAGTLVSREVGGRKRGKLGRV